MADKTKISWTNATVNAINGCSVLSPGCQRCYAMKLAGTRLKHHASRAGLTVDTENGPVWNGEVRLWPSALVQPLSWKAPRMIFWNAHGDLFHPHVPTDWIDQEFAVMDLTPHHAHQILTKRSERMRAYLNDPETPRRISAAAYGLVPSLKAAKAVWALESWPLPNVWVGVSVEDQKRANERIYDLMAAKAALRWLSVEPMLGPVNIMDAMWHRGAPTDLLCATIDWIVAGTESGQGRRELELDWVRALRDECARSATAFFVKQLPDGFGGVQKDITGFPKDLRIQEWPR